MSDTLWTEQLDAEIDRLMPWMQQVRRHLHANPEPSRSETKTAKYVFGKLQEAGFEPRLVANDCGVLADLPNGKRPVIAIRGDTDALRIQDQKQVEYRSRFPEVMHACGHDAHTSVVLGAAAALLRCHQAGSLPCSCSCRAIFQPAEETNHGALEMVQDGALDEVGAILALHVDPTRDVGTVGVRQGAFTADCVQLEFVVSGRGAHAARPHESLDPIATVAQLISALYLFVPRRIDSQEPVVVSFGLIHGGNNANVIPQEVVVRGTMRTLHPDVTRSTIDHIRRLANGVAAASETEIAVNYIAGPPAVRNDPALTRLIRSVSSHLLGEQHVHSIPRPSMGGEDFANYLTSIPGAMFRLGCRSGPDTSHPLHSPKFDLDERALAVGAKILARSVVSWHLSRNS